MSKCDTCINARGGACERFDNPGKILPIWIDYRTKDVHYPVTNYTTKPVTTYEVLACQNYETSIPVNLDYSVVLHFCKKNGCTKGAAKRLADVYGINADKVYRYFKSNNIWLKVQKMLDKELGQKGV